MLLCSSGWKLQIISLCLLALSLFFLSKLPRFHEPSNQRVKLCPVSSTLWHYDWPGLRLSDQAAGTRGLGGGEDDFPLQVHRPQVQPQVHNHGGHRLQGKESGEWCFGTHTRRILEFKMCVTSEVWFRITWGKVPMGWLRRTSMSTFSFGTQRDKRGNIYDHDIFLCLDVVLQIPKYLPFATPSGKKTSGNIKGDINVILKFILSTRTLLDQIRLDILLLVPHWSNCKFTAVGAHQSINTNKM